MRYCLHGRKSGKTGCTDERLAAQTKARTDPVRSDNRWQRQAELSVSSAKASRLSFRKRWISSWLRTPAKGCLTLPGQCGLSGCWRREGEMSYLERV